MNPSQDDVSPELQSLLSAASAPAHADELAGLPAVLTAFSLAPTTTRRSPVPGVIAKLVAIKTLVLVGGIGFLGGVALAASAGALPNELQTIAHETVGAPESKQQKAQERQAKEVQAAAVPGQCRAYAAGSKDEHGKARESRAFERLVVAAGGADKVEAFCAPHLRDEAKPTPSAKPEDAGKPETTGKPEGKGKPEHAGKPTSGPSVNHPSGKPSTLPTPSDLPTQAQTP